MWWVLQYAGSIKSRNEALDFLQRRCLNILEKRKEKVVDIKNQQCYIAFSHNTNSIFSVEIPLVLPFPEGFHILVQPLDKVFD